MDEQILELLAAVVGLGIVAVVAIWWHVRDKNRPIIVYKNGVPYIRKHKPGGGKYDYYEYREGERDPEMPYTDEELEGMSVSERIAIKRPNRTIRNLSANDCRCCGIGSAVSTYEFCRGVLCSRCADKYMASDLCGQNLESYGIVGKAKLYLWIEQRRLAMDVQEGLLTEEEAEIEAKNIFDYAVKSAARQKQKEEEYARRQEELKNKEQELIDITNRLF